MKLLVIGHSVFDLINSDDIHSEGAGGIYYTISALNRIKSPGDEISLCSQYDEVTYHHFSDEFEKIEKSYLQKVDSIPHVHLNLNKISERHESYENITNSLLLEYDNLNRFDGILINMITGFDISLNQLKQIRKNFNGKIFIDIHTLSRGLGANYKREFRPIPDFDDWAKNLDIIQANEHEIFTLSDKKNEMEIVEELFSNGVKIVCVTKGESGAIAYFNQCNQVSSYFVKTKKVDNANAIGCGDVFGAVFFYNYILSDDVKLSLELAVRSATLLLEKKFL
jgi:hypothetical protein